MLIQMFQEIHSTSKWVNYVQEKIRQKKDISYLNLSMFELNRKDYEIFESFLNIKEVKSIDFRNFTVEQEICYKILKKSQYTKLIFGDIYFSSNLEDLELSTMNVSLTDLEITIHHHDSVLGWTEAIKCLPNIEILTIRKKSEKIVGKERYLPVAEFSLMIHSFKKLKYLKYLDITDFLLNSESIENTFDLIKSGVDVKWRLDDFEIQDYINAYVDQNKNYYFICVSNIMDILFNLIKKGNNSKFEYLRISEDASYSQKTIKFMIGYLIYFPNLIGITFDHRFDHYILREALKILKFFPKIQELSIVAVDEKDETWMIELFRNTSLKDIAIHIDEQLIPFLVQSLESPHVQRLSITCNETPNFDEISEFIKGNKSIRSISFNIQNEYETLPSNSLQLISMALASTNIIEFQIFNCKLANHDFLFRQVTENNKIRLEIAERFKFLNKIPGDLNFSFSNSKRKLYHADSSPEIKKKKK
eukprot:gene12811-7163_t